MAAAFAACPLRTKCAASPRCVLQRRAAMEPRIELTAPQGQPLQAVDLKFTAEEKAYAACIAKPARLS